MFKARPPELRHCREPGSCNDVVLVLKRLSEIPAASFGGRRRLAERDCSSFGVFHLHKCLFRVPNGCLLILKKDVGSMYCC